jgi:hypothetical protein
MAIGFSLALYYVASLEINLENEKVSINPNGSQTIQQFIQQNVTEGMYVVAFPTSANRLELTITNPANQTILGEEINPSPFAPPIFGAFNITESGNYSLILTNLSSDTIEISAIIGDKESVESRGIKSSFNDSALIASSLFTVGIAIAIAGIIITVLDRQRTSKMKQFGDTSDLV